MINKTTLKDSKIGWRFDNSYIRLPDIMLSKLTPVPVRKPRVIILNHILSKELGLDFSNVSDENLSLIFSGNLLPEGSDSIAQAYAGHQFGHFTMLGDGRAIMIGEHLTPNNKRFDIQFKGSGRTPYSRGGDGRATLGPMLREYIISEAMNALNIPTTRSLAVVITGENVIRETSLPGSILTRVSASHIRVGTFQYVAMKGDLKTQRTLVDYTIDRHYPNLKGNKNSALDLLNSVMEKQIDLVINWMRVGFIHGVMNTDNMAISGETIDYGPCAFMDVYKPETVFSSIDHNGRYAFCNQPGITQWNLLKFAETLLPLIDKEKDVAIKNAEKCINNFSIIYKKKWLSMMRKKLGLFGEHTEDERLINNLLIWMNAKKADYTNTFLILKDENIFKNDLFKDNEFISWHKEWQKRLIKNKKSKESSLNLMNEVNPLVIPRNHEVEKVLEAATNENNLAPLNSLIDVLKNPYNYRSEIVPYQSTPEPNNKIYQTFCGT